MNLFGVAISFSDPKLSETCTSGIKICEHFVLTHCSLIWNLLLKSKPFLERKYFSLEKNSIDLIQNDLTQWVSNISFDVLCNDNSRNYINYHDQKSKVLSNAKDLPAIKQVAYIENIFVSPSLISDFSHLINDEIWEFEKSIKMSTSHLNLEIIYLSTFVILKMSNCGSICSCLSYFEKLILHPRKGAALFIDGCPFGVRNGGSDFLNSISKGIISNVSKDENIFLTDARCILGCEGAPGYSLNNHFGLCGIVVSPFCWQRGEWIGLTFMAALRPLMVEMRDFFKSAQMKHLSPVKKTHISHQDIELDHWDQLLTKMSLKPTREILEANVVLDIVDVIEKSIVRVMCHNASDWGTGFVVKSNKSLIVTCSHVTRGTSDKIVDIIFSNGDQCRGTVIFETNPRQQLPGNGDNFDHWDVSVISLSETPSFSLLLAKELPLIGTPVVVGGYPIFRSEALSSPCFVLGNLAKVGRAFYKTSKINLQLRKNEQYTTFNETELNENLVCLKWNKFSPPYDDIPISIQTTCGIYNGVSGGPVVALHPLKGAVVIGIISSCARDFERKINFPHVNVAMPSILLAEAIDSFNITNDLSSFDVLKRKYFADSHHSSLHSKL